jgi:hypothetical protein
MVDPKDWFESASCKWQKIANAMNANGHLLLPKNTTICKNKWGAIFENFKCSLTT